MDHFVYKGDEAYCEGVPLRALAQAFGTPAYIYSSATLLRHCALLQKAFSSHPTSFCYAVKANSNLSLLQSIFAAGFGADVVSQGELERALLAGAKPEKIVYSGVGKKEEEIARALDVGILSFNVESFFELELIASVAAKKNKKAPISLRLNPDIDAKTHPKIATGLHSTKFGIAMDQLPHFLNFLHQQTQHLELIGLACHIGSQLTELSPLGEAASKMSELVQQVKSQGFPIRFLNLGGGLGIRYTDEKAPSVEDYAATLLKHLKDKGLDLIVEPGRVLVGNAGVLLTEVQGLKKTAQKRFVIVDAAMNDLIRPTLYGSQHEICPVRPFSAESQDVYDIVGPICETGDFLGKDVHLPPLQAGDLLYIRGCGAYSASMASNYNSRPRSVEVLVEGEQFRVIRPRESLSDLWQSELQELRSL